MSIEVRYADDPAGWDDLVERSPEGTPFHLWGFLQVLSDHANATLHPLIGYVGQEPVGLVPIFRIRRGPLTALLSPPPQLKVSYCGPILVNFGKLKRRRAEERHRELVDTCLDFLGEELSPNYVHLRTTTRYGDVRPFVWNGFSASPGYTYVVDLSPGPDGLLEAFSTDARQNIRNGSPDAFEIREGGPEVIERVVSQLQTRHAELAEDYPLTAGYVVDLWRALPDGVVRPYAATMDGSFVGGTVTLRFADTVYAWQGGAKNDADLPTNDLLKWRVMRDAIDAGIARYDLVGANNPRISTYKSKFAPELEQYHELTRGSALVRLAVDAYRRFR